MEHSVADDKPTVSVLMAARNAESTLAEALSSIAEQTFAAWELIVCDDASSDRTLDLLREFQRKHPGRVTILQNEVQSYLARSLNRCLPHVRGDFIARMDADDVSHPSRLQRQLGFLIDNPNVDLVGTAYYRFDSDGSRDVVTLPSHPDKFALRQGPPFAHGTVMVRSEVLIELGGYNESKRTRRGQDYELWFRFFHHGFVGRNLSEPLYMVREDASAVKRRTLRGRLAGFITTVQGYRLLKFPPQWYVLPVLRLAKGFVPSRAVLVYRRMQYLRYTRSNEYQIRSGRALKR